MQWSYIQGSQLRSLPCGPSDLLGRCCRVTMYNRYNTQWSYIQGSQLRSLAHRPDDLADAVVWLCTKDTAGCHWRGLQEREEWHWSQEIHSGKRTQISRLWARWLGRRCRVTMHNRYNTQRSWAINGGLCVFLSWLKLLCCCAADHHAASSDEHVQCTFRSTMYSRYVTVVKKDKAVCSTRFCVLEFV